MFWRKKKWKKFNRGQKVRVKSWLFTNANENIYAFMRRREGKIVTIKERYYNDYYHIYEDDGCYEWHACCFKPIKISKQQLVNDLLNGKISYEEYMELKEG